MDAFVWLLPTVHVSTFEEEIVLRRGSAIMRLQGDIGRVEEVLSRLDGSRTRTEASTDVLSEQLISVLSEESWLVELTRPLKEVIGSTPAISRQLSYFAHIQARFPDRAVDELHRSRVLMIGVGGIGSHVAQALAGAGVQHLILSDPDVIDATNLNRQFFYTEADVGRRKVDVAAEFLSARHSKLTVDRIAENLFESPRHRDVLDDIDLIVFAGDGDTVGRYADVVGTNAILVAGYQGAIGQVGPLTAPRHGTPCWSCAVRATGGNATLSLDAKKRKRSSAWNSSGSSINGTLGGLASEVAIRWLAPSLGGPLLLDTVLQIEMGTLEQTSIPLNLSPCPHTSGCVQRPSRTPAVSP